MHTFENLLIRRIHETLGRKLNRVIKSMTRGKTLIVQLKMYPLLKAYISEKSTVLHFLEFSLKRFLSRTLFHKMLQAEVHSILKIVSSFSSSVSLDREIFLLGSVHILLN